MTQVLTGSGYGLRVGLRGAPDTLDAVRPLLPFWWRDDAGPPQEVFDLDGEVPPDSVVRTMEHWVAEHAVDRVFIHAAVVAVDGRALLLPGSSYAGKTTLCVELLRRGATYLSDEYAVLDAEGMVHPYPRALRVREARGMVRTDAESLGALTASRALPVAAVAFLSYLPDSLLTARRLSPASAVLLMLEHAIAARSATDYELEVIARSLSGVSAVIGRRGTAAQAAETLLRRMKAQAL